MLQWNDVNATVEFVEVDVFDRSIQLIRPQWTSEDGTRFIRTDAIQLEGIYWPETSLQVDSIQLGNWVCEGNWNDDKDTDSPPWEWKSTWPSMFSDANIESLSWASGLFRSDSMLVVEIEHGHINRLSMSSEEVHWGAMDMEEADSYHPCCLNLLNG